MRMSVIAGSILVLLAASSATAQSRTTDAPFLVSTAWLAEHLQDPAVVILWTGQRDPGKALIPGTRLVPHESLMTMQDGHDLAATGDLVAALEGAGVSNSSHVVIYGEPLSAGWLFFALDYLGHDRTSILDGGAEKWRAESRSVTASPTSGGRGSFKPAVRSRLRVTADDVQAQMKSGRTILLDARSAEEYAGGRIPGAKLVTWQDVYADPTLQVFKSRDALAALFQEAGAAPGAAAIAYCQVGLRSSVLYFAARYAGLDVANYVGSWSEWSQRGLPREPPAR